jgi:hypothetical protein
MKSDTGGRRKSSGRGELFHSGGYRIAKGVACPFSEALSSAVMYRASIDGRFLFRRVPVRSIVRSGSRPAIVTANGAAA